MKIGWIGLGKMGVPMSKRLTDAGHDVSVYNRTTEKEEPLKKEGASSSTSPAELIEKTDVVFLMVSDDDAVREIFCGSGGLLKNKPKGKIIINMSTVSPAISREMAKLCKDIGSHYLDAPVSGSVKQAQEGTLVVIVGGEMNIFEKVSDLLETLGKSTVRVGENGTGNAAKLAVNTFLGVVTQGLAEAIKFSKAMGVKTEDLLEILNNGALGSPYIKIKGDTVLQNNYNAAFTLEHLAKDLRLAKSSGLHEALGVVAHDTFQEAESELGSEDVMAIFKYIKDK